MPKANKSPPYKPEYCDKVVEFFSRPAAVTASKKTYYSDGSLKSEEAQPMACEFPTMQEFASSLGVGSDVLSRWRSRHRDFDCACSRAEELQESIWLKNSIAGRYNSSFAQYVGSACFGYKKRAEKPFKVTLETLDETDTD